MYEVGPGLPQTDDTPSTGPTYRNVYSQNGFPKLDGVNSLYEVFQKSVRERPNQDCLGVRPKGSRVYEWETYQVPLNSSGTKSTAPIK